MEPRKYFLDKKGAVTFRVRGGPGTGHYDIGKEVLLDRGHQLAPAEGGLDYAGVYARMFELGYARVVESKHELEVESPRPLTTAQKRFVKAKEAEGKTVRRVRPAKEVS